MLCNTKFINGVKISTSNANDYSLSLWSYLHPYIDENHFENVVTTDGTYQYIEKRDFIHYSGTPAQIDFSHVTTSFLVDSLNRFLSYNSNYLIDTLCIKTNGITSYIQVPGAGGGSLWNSGVEICIDHANRIWVMKNHSINMYDGNTWSSDSTNMIPFYSSGNINWPTRVFAEFGTNKFVVANYDFHQTVSNGNGIYYFSYAPNTVNIKAFEIKSAKAYYNSASSKIIASNTEHISSYSLFDISGKELMTKKNLNENSFVIDVDQYPSGIYFLKCSTADLKNQTFKILIP